MLRQNPIMLPPVPSTGPSHVSFCARKNSLLCSDKTLLCSHQSRQQVPSHVGFCARKNSLLCSGKTLLCSHQSRQQVPSHVSFCARKNSLLCSDKTLLCSHQSRQQVLLMLASVLGKTLYYAQTIMLPPVPSTGPFSCWLLC